MTLLLITHKCKQRNRLHKAKHFNLRVAKTPWHSGCSEWDRINYPVNEAFENQNFSIMLEVLFKLIVNNRDQSLHLNEAVMFTDDMYRITGRSTQNQTIIKKYPVSFLIFWQDFLCRIFISSLGHI